MCLCCMDAHFVSVFCASPCVSMDGLFAVDVCASMCPYLVCFLRSSHSLGGWGVGGYTPCDKNHQWVAMTNEDEISRNIKYYQ